MKTWKNNLLIPFFTLLLTLSLPLSVLGVDASKLQNQVNSSAVYLYQTTTNPQVGSIGGEWVILGLARSGCPVPNSCYQNYYASVEAYVKACKGVLHEHKYTEYSRVILALTAIGKDPTNVAGYNLLTPLGDYEKTIWQGVNGPIWALIALDSASYPMPKNPTATTQATRQMYVNRILSCQLTDGGWSLYGNASSSESSDPDMTGMALQALAKYTSDPTVQSAVDRALLCLSSMQNTSGGFSSGETASAESVVQVIVGLSELGIPLDDARFVKNGNTLLNNLLSYRMSDGSFQHCASGSGSNQMASEQGFYGIVSALRASEKKNSLYRMSDSLHIETSGATQQGVGLPGKRAEVTSVPITKPRTTFPDIMYSDSISAIEALASRGIITGKGDGSFAPEECMTRAQFTAIVVRALGLTPKVSNHFQDVPSSEWYASYVGTASSYHIVSGKTNHIFDPNGTITKQEAAVMVARAAKLCGLETTLAKSEVHNTLAGFDDYIQVSDWARESLAFCYAQHILDQSALDIHPTSFITRAEIASMLFHMLSQANLLS